MLKVLQTMYDSVKSCVRSNNQISDFISAHNGLKQGDPLSPIMFMFFINDIVTSINTDIEQLFSIDELTIFMLLYADDAVIFSTSEQNLQTLLINLEKYCNTWDLKINTNKTKIMVFEKGRPTHPKLYLNNVELEVVASFKYLGVELYKNGNWNRTQKHIAQHSEYSLHRLYNVFNNLTFPISEKCKMFDSVIGSKLNYASEVWWFHEAPDIERIHTKFCRSILGVRKSTNLDALYGELGRYNLKKLSQIKNAKILEENTR